MKCKICGKNADSEYCFQHKPRKGFKRGENSTLKSKKGFSVGKTPQKDKKATEEMHNFFLTIWDKKPHICENCTKSLGNEPLSYMFDHLLEKSKYPELKLEEKNIMLTCLECHNNKTNGFLSPYVQNRIKIIRNKFGI